jgi:hypothetical protein
MLKALGPSRKKGNRNGKVDKIFSFQIGREKVAGGHANFKCFCDKFKKYRRKYST